MEQAERPGASMSAFTEDERYRLLIEAVTDYAIFMLDADGIVASWNPGAKRLKGYESYEIIGQHFSRFYSEEDRNSGLAARALATARRTGKFEIEGWRVRKDGSRFWAYVVIDPIRSPSGKTVGYAKITRDLSERKEAEEALKKSEQQFRLLVEGVTDYAIYMLDPQGRISSWNSGARRIKGYTPEEIIGQHFSQFYTPEDRAAGAPQHALETAAQQGRFENEAWRVRKDGSRFWAHVVLDPIHADDGSIIGYAKITRDITERKETAKKLEEARERLLQSQKMEAIGHLTGGIAHDFNNLLMAVLGSLELARKRIAADDKRLLALVDNAVLGAQRGAILTRRMLAFARRQDLNNETVRIPELVIGMTEMLQRSIGSQISIETRFPVALSPVRSDANQLEMALLNLVVNARDAMLGGGQIIMAGRDAVIRSDEPGGLKAGRYVCLSVQDSGDGMDRWTLERAMEPFFTTKEPGKGTGLGLPMVHGLAEQSGGRFVLKSQPAQGTTAELWLPVDERTNPAVEKRAAAREADRHQPLLIVLAVDDDPLVLTNTVAMLEDLGHTAIGVSSAKAALETLRQDDSIDLVITDQIMPQMTGVQLADAIKAEWPELEVILASGFVEAPAGIQRLPRLSKPFNQSELAAKVAEVHSSLGKARVLKFPAAQPKA
ncbi:MAG: PAS domain S-box protein [Xanthobacteraceae bacterium]